jgi:recombinational DNA repair protein RecR
MRYRDLTPEDRHEIANEILDEHMERVRWEWQCPVCENWRTGETCHTCGTHEKESRHHREKR